MTRYLSIRDVAERLGYSDDWVRRLAVHQRIPGFFRVGGDGDWRIGEDDLTAFVAKSKAVTTYAIKESAA